MELYNLPEDLTVMGVHVKNFPIGIKDAFDGLAQKLGLNRAYYGLSWMDADNNIVYYAMAGEISSDEAKHHGYQTLTIEKGAYKTESILNWMSKTDTIKDVFHVLMGDQCPDRNHPCIEWYCSDDEMLCMIRNI